MNEKYTLNGLQQNFFCYDISDFCVFFFSSRRRHTRLQGDWSSDVCSSDPHPARSSEKESKRSFLQKVAEFIHPAPDSPDELIEPYRIDRKSTRLNSSHLVISYAVFCLKKKKTQPPIQLHTSDTPTARRART